MNAIKMAGSSLTLPCLCPIGLQSDGMLQGKVFLQGLDYRVHLYLCKTPLQGLPLHMHRNNFIIAIHIDALKVQSLQVVNPVYSYIYIFFNYYYYFYWNGNTLTAGRVD